MEIIEDRKVRDFKCAVHRNLLIFILLALIVPLIGCSTINDLVLGKKDSTGDNNGFIIEETGSKTSVTGVIKEPSDSSINEKGDKQFVPDEKLNITKEDISDSEKLLDRSSLSLGRINTPYDFLPKYRIMPGDVLDVLYQIRTWHEKKEFKISVDHTVSVKFVHFPEMNETQLVRPDGTISLPYLGEVRVVGKTVKGLREELLEAYKKILRAPEIYITVPEFRSSITELKKDLHTAPRGLSRLATVRPDGYVTFPMVGEKFVGGKTITEINKILNEEYDNMIPGLHCDLFLEKHAGSVVYVLGQVKFPGSYKISRPVSVIEAVALAGSYIPGAKIESVIVARKYGNKVIGTRVNLRKVLGLRNKSSLVYLQPDDIVYVPKTYIKRAAEIADDIAKIFFFRGWGASVSFSYELYNANSGGSSSRSDQNLRNLVNP